MNQVQEKKKKETAEEKLRRIARLVKV